MHILLDTHIFLWAVADPTRLSEERLQAIQTRANDVFVSAVSVTEIVIKASLGKISADFDPAEMIVATGFEPVSYGVEDAMHLATLPHIHRDPFDRMLVSQALVHGWTLMTDDAEILRYDVPTM